MRSLRKKVKRRRLFVSGRSMAINAESHLATLRTSSTRPYTVRPPQKCPTTYSSLLSWQRPSEFCARSAPRWANFTDKTSPREFSDFLPAPVLWRIRLAVIRRWKIIFFVSTKMNRVIARKFIFYKKRNKDFFRYFSGQYFFPFNQRLSWLTIKYVFFFLNLFRISFHYFNTVMRVIH